MTTTSPAGIFPTSPAFAALPPQTRIWIYQSNREIPGEIYPVIKDVLKRFSESWTSHSKQLRAYADLLQNRFLILAVDESTAGASGCSIDTSVRFIQQLGEQLKVDFFDRLTFAWLENGEVKTAPQESFIQLFTEGKINKDSLVFDNLVNNKADFERGWIKPLGKSWHKRMVEKG